jgi:hypothetical protein
MIGSIIQVIISIILVILLAIIGYSIYNSETLNALNNYNTVKKQTLIFDGVIDFKSGSNYSYNTLDKTSGTYVDLTPSINQNGGAEYTYNFWLYKDKSKLASESGLTSDDLVLLLRGSKKALHYTSENCSVNNELNKYIMIKNPLIRMKSDGSSIIVEYNTLTSPDAYHDGGNNQINCGSTWFDKNKGLLGIYNIDSTYDSKWFMVTVILQEINPNNDILYKNRTVCRMYINGVLMLDRVVESPYDGTVDGSAAMRHNKGPLYIRPTGIYKNASNDASDNITVQERALMMANLSYYNYALTDIDVEALFKSGFTHSPAKVPLDTKNEASLYAMSPALSKGNNLPKPF